MSTVKTSFANARNISITLLLLAYHCVGCGPITAHSAIARAHIAINAAEGARAEENAIFEYNSALLYLEKAKREEGLSSFEAAIRLADQSRSFADQARARALKKSKARPMTPTERRRALQTTQPVAPPPARVAPLAPSSGIPPTSLPAPATPSVQPPAPPAGLPALPPGR